VVLDFIHSILKIAGGLNKNNFPAADSAVVFSQITFAHLELEFQNLLFLVQRLAISVLKEKVFSFQSLFWSKW